MTEAPKNLVHSRALHDAEALHVEHPLNPASQVAVYSLSRMTGMKRAHVSLGRVPPGKESFLPHAHGVEEEWIYILEGRARALIGDSETEVGPGDFMGFPTDGTVHHLTNIGDTDLVYLMGGESSALEVSRFPSLGKIAIMQGDEVRLFDEAAGEVRKVSDWVAKRPKG